MRRMPEERENELVLMAQKGSTKAFGELEKQYHWLVFKVAKDALCEVAGAGAEVEAEDVTQDVFEYAFVHIGDYKPGRFYRWLWALAKNRALRVRHRLWRKIKREVEYHDEQAVNRNENYREGWDSLPADGEVLAKYLNPAKWEDDTIKGLAARVRSLPKQQRADLEAYADGEKPRHIAKRTRRGVEAIKKSIGRAKHFVKMSTI